MADGVDPGAEKRVGSVLNEKWTLERLLGAGGMGAVYAARHRNGARAAVKVLYPELAKLADVRERFVREGYAANRVEHRGAVQVLDDDIIRSGSDEGSAYLVMELLEGESLQDRVNRGPKLTERELLEIMDAVLDVLAAAHEHGVVHRDLKPENIFLAKDPELDGVRVKVLDFGLARIAEAAGVTNAGMAVGTPSFMSPEQAAGHSLEIDGRTDVFALGATVFRIFTGRRLHQTDNMVQLVVLMAQAPAPTLQSVVPTTSDVFARVIDRALTFERADRPDAIEMQKLVRAARDELAKGSEEGSSTLSIIPFSARSFRVLSQSEIGEPKAEPARAATGEVDEAEEDGAPRKKSRRAIGLWVAALVLLGLGAWLLPVLQSRLSPRAPMSSSPPITPPGAGEPTAEGSVASASLPIPSSAELRAPDAEAAAGDDDAPAFDLDDLDDAGLIEAAADGGVEPAASSGASTAHPPTRPPAVQPRPQVQPKAPPTPPHTAKPTPPKKPPPKKSKH